MVSASLCKRKIFWGGKEFCRSRADEKGAGESSAKPPGSSSRGGSGGRPAESRAGRRRSQAAFRKNNAWLRGRKEAAKEKDFQQGSFGFCVSPPTPDTCAKKPDFLTSSAKE